MKNEEMRVLTDADLKNIQGIIISGYQHLKHSAYLFLKFDDPSLAKTWLKELLPAISSANWRFEYGSNKPANAVNIAFTQTGTDVFEKQITNLSQEFQDGMAEVNRSRRLGDVDSSSPENWEIRGEKAHVLLMLQAKDERSINDLIAQYDAINKKYAVENLYYPLKGYFPLDKKEHFGFSDSISQPFIENSPAAKTTTETSVKAGEFILGYTNEYLQFPSTPIAPQASDEHNSLPELPNGNKAFKDFGFNGSYLVFRKLFQDVPKFQNYLTSQVPDATERGRVAAKCIGRWPSGAPLINAPDTDITSMSEKNDFIYSKDPSGNSCPVGSHIRRANPRDSLRVNSEESWAAVNRHRIIRRGALYGDRFTGNEPDDKDRGLYFIAINTDIKRQFEFIQQTWLNNSKFGDLYNERDPIVGSNLESQVQKGHEHYITLPSHSIRKRYKDFPRIVTAKGGGYFFLPSIPALRFLAGIAGPVSKPEPVLHPGEKFEKNETKLIYSFAAFLKAKMAEDYFPKNTKRDAHPKTLGLFKAELTVGANIPDHLQTSIFSESGKVYQAWIRISNSKFKIQSDEKKDMRGIAIKLIEVEENRQSDELNTQDFIMISRPDMPMGTIQLTRDFIRDTQRLKFLGLIKHLVVFTRMFRGFKNHINPLDIRYWSTTPYLFNKTVVKYSIKPTSDYRSKLPEVLTQNYLSETMQKCLRQKDATFDFMIQEWRNNELTPIENAAKQWKEQDSPFISIATLKIPIQEFYTERREFLAEQLSFSPSHTTPDIKPLGGLNRARGIIYQLLSKYRHHRDGKPPIKHNLEHYNSEP